MADLQELARKRNALQLNRCLQRLHDKAGQTQTGDDKKQLSSRHSQVSFAG